MLPEADESLEHGLVFAGIVGMIDPPREEVGDAIAEARGAGIRVVMITGDHVLTASRIASQLGISGPAGDVVAITGIELETLDEATLRAMLENAYFDRKPPKSLDRLDFGREAVAVSRIDGDVGQVRINGELWSARAFDPTWSPDGFSIEPFVRIEGRGRSRGS